MLGVTSYYCYADCRYAECHHAEWRDAQKTVKVVGFRGCQIYPACQKHFTIFFLLLQRHPHSLSYFLGPTL